MAHNTKPNRNERFKPHNRRYFFSSTQLMVENTKDRTRLASSDCNTRNYKTEIVSRDCSRYSSEKKCKLVNFIAYKVLLGSCLSYSILGQVMKLEGVFAAVVKCWVTFEVTLIFGICSFFYHVPGLNFVIETGMKKMTGLHIPKKNYWHTFLGWEMFKSVRKSRLVDITKKARSGNEAQNVPLVSTDGKRCVRLLDLLKADRPLVVYFGSCSCPVFMSKLREFGDLAQDYSDIVDFVVVYIEEAHPEDGWSFKNNFIKVKQHRSQEERCRAAQKLQELNLPCEILVDTMEDNANIAYGALPERLYAIEEGKVAYVGGQGPMNSSMKEAREWLACYREKNTFRRWTL